MERPTSAFIALVAGFVGALLMAYATYVAPNRPTLILSFTCGLGVLLGAFGTTATVKGKGWVISGAGAIGLLLGGAYLSFEDKPIFGDISGQFTATTDITLTDEHPVLGAMHGGDGDRKYEFALKRARLKDGELTIVVKEEGEKFGKRLTIAEETIARDLSLGEDMHWTYDGRDVRSRDRKVISNLNSDPDGSALPSYGEKYGVPGIESWNRFIPFTLVPSAFAQPRCEQRVVEENVSALSSDSVDVQTRATTALMECELASVAALLAALPTASDGARHEILYALLAIARQAPDRSRDMAEIAGPAELSPVVDALDDGHAETATLAGALLVELRDPEAGDLVIQFGAKTSDRRARRRAVSVLEGLLGRMGVEDQQKVHTAVDAMRDPRDRQLAEAIDGFGKSRFFIVAGSFVRRGDAVARARRLDGKLAPSRAEVWRLTNSPNYYVVCIGPPLTLTAAYDERGNLIAKGAAPRDAWLVMASRLSKVAA